MRARTLTPGRVPTGQTVQLLGCDSENLVSAFSLGLVLITLKTSRKMESPVKDTGEFKGPGKA